MREATIAEYGRATSIPHAEKRIMESARTQTVEWTYCGRPIASCVKVYKRGKIVNVMHYVDPEFLK